MYAQIINGMRNNSVIVHLNFSNELSSPIQAYFKTCTAQGIDPKKPENRQRFNDLFLEKNAALVLLGQYGEDRSAMLAGTKIAQEGRTIHMGVDLFTKSCEDVYAPTDGEIIQSGFEEGPASYGYYCLIDHRNYGHAFLTFYGHLDSVVEKRKVLAGEKFAKLGNHSQNGGWSIHLHFQILTSAPKEGETPAGYCKPDDFNMTALLYPNPNSVLQIKELGE